MSDITTVTTEHISEFYVSKDDSEEPTKKKLKSGNVTTSEADNLHLSKLPDALYYEKSYMHRSTVSHIIVTRTDFIISGSVDGNVKFWKKADGAGIDFVKHFRAHLSPLIGLIASDDGLFCCSFSEDKSCKIFDVINFDMINILKLAFIPLAACFIYNPDDAAIAIAISAHENASVHVFDARGSSEPLRVLDRLHSRPVQCIAYNAVFGVVISSDLAGAIEYWSGPSGDYAFPERAVHFQYKSDTSLFELARRHTTAIQLALSPDGLQLAVLCADRSIRLFNFLTGFSRLCREHLVLFHLQIDFQFVLVSC